MTEKLQALGYVSLKNLMVCIRDRGIRQLPGYSHYKELEQYKMLLYIF